MPYFLCFQVWPHAVCQSIPGIKWSVSNLTWCKLQKPCWHKNWHHVLNIYIIYAYTVYAAWTNTHTHSSILPSFSKILKISPSLWWVEQTFLIQHSSIDQIFICTGCCSSSLQGYLLIWRRLNFAHLDHFTCIINVSNQRHANTEDYLTFSLSLVTFFSLMYIYSVVTKTLILYQMKMYLPDE